MANNIVNNLNISINTLSDITNNIISNYTTLENNLLLSKYINKSGDTINGTLNITNIDNNSYINIGKNSSNIKIGSLTNQDNKIINIGKLSDTLTINGSISNFVNNTDINMNNNKIININNGINNNDGVNKLQLTNNITTAINNLVIPQSLSSLTGNNITNINLNNYKIQNIATATSNKDIINVGQYNNLLNTAKNTITLNNFTFDNNINNIVYDNGITGKVNNNHIDDKTIDEKKLKNYPNNTTTVLLGDGTFGKITNNHIDNNIINASKFINYPNDGTKYLTGDGTFKIMGSNISMTLNNSTVYFDPNNIQYVNNLDANNYKIINLKDPIDQQDAITKNYIDNIVFNSINNYLINNSINLNKLVYPGSGTKMFYNNSTFKNNLNISNIKCKILIYIVDTSITIDNNNDLINKLNNMIIYLGGSLNNIQITSIISLTDSLTYNSDYDVICYSGSNTTLTESNTVLNQYYNNGKGIVLGYTNIYPNIVSNITNLTGSSINTNINNQNISINHPITYGISNIIPYKLQSVFSTNNSNSLGTWNSTNAINYLDVTNMTYSKGRRIDLNFYPIMSINNELITNYTGATRCLLQACIWCSRK